MRVGQLELKPEHVSQTMTVKVGDKSGYTFTVLAYQEDGDGAWNAKVSMHSYGFVSAENAVLHLRHAAENFVRMLSDKQD